MALEKPLITSDWPLLRETFNRGTINVDNTVAGITAGIETALRNHRSLALEMKMLRLEEMRNLRLALITLYQLSKITHTSPSHSDNNKESAAYESLAYLVLRLLWV